MSKVIIDLSSHNGAVDFKKLSDVSEVIIRATLGYGTSDKLLHDHAHAAHAAGLPVSYYHFAYPSVDKADDTVCSDATKEAAYFIETISKLPQFTRLVVDLENWNAATGKDSALNPEDYCMWLECFLQKVEDMTGAECVIYSYADYLNRHLPKDHQFGKYPLWLANYGKVEHPPLPHGWLELWAWQYSETGSMEGIDGHVDLSKTA